jgi:hypothetical protein
MGMTQGKTGFLNLLEAATKALGLQACGSAGALRPAMTEVRQTSKFAANRTPPSRWEELRQAAQVLPRT